MAKTPVGIEVTDRDIPHALGLLDVPHRVIALESYAQQKFGRSIHYVCIVLLYVFEKVCMQVMLCVYFVDSINKSFVTVFISAGSGNRSVSKLQFCVSAEMGVSSGSV